MAEEHRTQPVATTGGGAALNQNSSTLTPTLVRAVTEKVYALLLADLQIERERLRLTWGARQGERGWR